MNVYVVDEDLFNTCHISCLNDFREHNNYNSYTRIKDLIPCGGAGWIVVGFVVDDKLSEQVFEDCSEKWDVMFVSDIRVNRNTGKKVYMAVFQARTDQKYGFDDKDGDPRRTNASDIGLDYDGEDE